MRHDGLEARHLRQPLSEWVSPAGMTPHLGLFAQTPHFQIERVHIIVHRQFPLSPGCIVQAWLFDLDDGAAGIGQPVILFVQRAREGFDRFAAVLVKPVGNLLIQVLGAAAPHLDRLVREALRGFPYGVVLQLPCAQRSDDKGAHPDRFVQDVSRHVHSPLRSASLQPHDLARISLLQALHPIQNVRGPGAAADVDIEAHFAVAQNVETGPCLVRDERGDGIAVLLPINGIARKRREERTPCEVGDEPGWSRKRPRDRCRERSVLRCSVHHFPKFMAIKPGRLFQSGSAP